MNKQTCIYVLFKEYVDASRAPSAPYIHGEEYPLFKDGVLNEELLSVIEVLEFFSYEHANFFYDQANINGLLYQPLTLEMDDYPGYDSALLSQLQELGMTLWTECPAVIKDTFRFEGNDVSHTMLGDMSQREVDKMATLDKIAYTTTPMTPAEKEYEPCVMFHLGAVNTVDGQFEESINGNRVLILSSASSVKELHSWLSENRFPKREYHFNPKHGDANHPARMIIDRHGTHPAAQLLTTTEQTEELLKLAVGKDLNSELWYFDNEHHCHIFFENEGNHIPPSFHGYHLHPGDDNYENIDLEKLERLLTR